MACQPRNIVREFGTPSLLWRADSVSDAVNPIDIVSFLGRATARRGRTLVEGVRSLPPWHEISQSSRSVRRFGHVPLRRTAQPPIEEFARGIREKVEAAVVSCLGANSRVGLMLSGGLDSSIIASILADLKTDTTCYVCHTRTPDRQSDVEHARRLATLLRFPLVEVRCEIDEVFDSLKLLRRHWPYPLVCWVTLIQLNVARRAASDGCKVLFMGTGSDEVFGGYDRTAEFAWRAELLTRSHGARELRTRITASPSSARNDLICTGLSCPFPPRLLRQLVPSVDHETALYSDLTELYAELFAADSDPSYDACMLQQELEMRTSEVLMTELSLPSRLFGVPVRFPFLHPSLLEYVSAMPIDLKYRFDPTPELRWRSRRKAVEKYALRMAFQHRVPGHVQRRSGRAYTVPFSEWVCDVSFRERLLRRTLNSRIWSEIGASLPLIPKLFAPSTSREWSRPHQIWLLYQLATWWDHDGPSRLFEGALVVGR